MRLGIFCAVVILFAVASADEIPEHVMIPKGPIHEAKVEDWAYGRGIRVNEGVTLTPDPVKGWKLVTKNLILNETAILTVPKRAMIVAKKMQGTADLMDKDAPTKRVFTRYFMELPKDVPLPGVVEKEVASKCYPPHFQKLYELSRPRSPVTWGGQMVKSRAFKTKYGTALIPVIDMANHISSKHANAEVVEPMPGSPEEESQSLVLVSTQMIPPNTEILMSYGNIRSWVDMVEGYGFINVTDIDAIPAQITFPQANSDNPRLLEHLRELGCVSNHESHTLNVTDGAPSETLLYCMSLFMLSDPDQQRLFFSGTMPVLSQLSLKIVAYRRLRDFCHEAQGEYMFPYEVLREDRPMPYFIRELGARMAGKSEVDFLESEKKWENEQGYDDGDEEEELLEALGRGDPDNRVPLTETGDQQLKSECTSEKTGVPKKIQSLMAQASRLMMRTYWRCAVVSQYRSEMLEEMYEKTKDKHAGKMTSEQAGVNFHEDAADNYDDGEHDEM